MYRRVLLRAALIAAVGLLPRPSLAGEGPAEGAPAEVKTEAPQLEGSDVQPTAQPAPAPAPTAAPRVEGGQDAVSVPAPRVDAPLSLKGTIVWDGLKDKRIHLEMADGTTVSGTVVTQDAGNIALARASDGMVVAVPKGEVRAIKVRREVAASGIGRVMTGLAVTESGRSNFIAGGVLLGFGCPTALAGLVMLGLCPSCFYIHLPLLLPGSGMVVGGAVAIKRGKQKEQKMRRVWGIPMAKNMHLTPNFAFTREGGAAGFTLRF